MLSRASLAYALRRMTASGVKSTPFAVVARTQRQDFYLATQDALVSAKSVLSW